MAYRLYYWALRGRGEQIRLLLHELGQDYEEVHVDMREGIAALKREGPRMLAFGSVPMLEDGGFRLAQGPAIMNYLGREHGLMPADPRAAASTEAMVLGAEDMRMAYFRTLGNRSDEKKAKFVGGDWRERWLPSWSGLLELNGDTGYLVGPSLTQADVAVWDALDAILIWVEGATLDGFPRLRAFYDSIGTRPRIADYLLAREGPASSASA